MARVSELTGFPAAALILLGAVLFVGTAAPASAQGFACTGAPGERQVGMSGGGNGTPPVPICVNDGSAAQPSRSQQMRRVDNYYAAAWHANSSNAWISAGYLSKGRAEMAALAACNKVMGGGCVIARSNFNGTVVIVRGLDGAILAMDRTKRSDAEKAALDYCRKQNGECAVINSVTASPGSAPVGARVQERSQVFEPRGNPYHRYGAMARVDREQLAGKPATNDVWIVGGRPSAEQASADALKLCQSQLGTPCSVALVAPDVFLAVAERDGKEVSASLGPTVEIAKRRVLLNCKTKQGKGKGKCRVAATFDLTQDQALRFDPVAR